MFYLELQDEKKLLSRFIVDSQQLLNDYFLFILVPFQLVGGVHKLNEIN